MPITIVQKPVQHMEQQEIRTRSLTIQKNREPFEQTREKFAALITNLPIALTYREFKAQVFPDFDAMYIKVSDGVFFAVMREKEAIMRFCKKYNLARVESNEIRCTPVIKLDVEKVIDVELKK